MEVENMKNFSLVLVVLVLTSCANMTHQQQRALSGGAIGAAAGVALTAATGGSNLLLGGVLGGAGGAAIGAVTH
jgi:hypothetical protein